MEPMRFRVLAFVIVAALAGVSQGQQEETIVSLPWTSGLSAGPNGSDYEPPNDHLDLWVIEDFTTDRGYHLTRFQSTGALVNPQVLYDVTVRIYEGFPPEGTLLLQTPVGAGTLENAGQWKRFVSNFGGQYLPRGSYFIAWSAAVATNNGSRAVMFAQGGGYQVGQGGPDNAWLWNPNGGWGFENNYKFVPADFDSDDQIGVNFGLFGVPSCPGDFNGDTAVNSLDFFAFLNAYAAGHPSADFNGDTVVNSLDFFAFLNAYVAGCE